MQVIDSNLRLAVNETKKEFDAHKKDSNTLIDGVKGFIKELQDKFQVLDQAMAKVDVAAPFLRANTDTEAGAGQAGAAQAPRQPFLDPKIGQVNRGAEHFDVSTPKVDTMGGLPLPGGARAMETQLPGPLATSAAAAAPMRYPPGYADYRDLPGPGQGASHPDNQYEEKARLRYDSKTFETKVAQDKNLQFDGGKSGISW